MKRENAHCLWTFMVMAIALGGSSARSQDITWESTHGPFRGVVMAMTLTGEGTLLVGLNEAGTNNVYRSTDKGDTWSKVLPGTGYVLAFGVDSAGGKIYMGMEGNILLRSTDDGSSWAPIPPPAHFVRAILPLSGNRLLAGTDSGIFLTDDDGQHWSQRSSASGNNSVYAMTFTPWGALLIGTFLGGVYTSPDTGVNWTSVGLQGSQWAGPLACTATGTCFAGSNDGLFLSTDRGSSWNAIVPTTDGVHALAVEPGGGLIIGRLGRAYFTLNPILGISFSTDNGTTWTNQQLTKYGIIGILRDADGNLFVGTDGGVHRSTDGGNSWRMVGVTGFPTMALASLSDGTIFAGDDMDCAVYRSTNQGDDWSRVAWGFSAEGGEIMDMTANSQDHLFASTFGYLYRTTNAGALWQRLLPAPIHQVTFDQQGYGFAASLRNASAIGGVFFSPDSGATWGRIASAEFDVFSVAANGPLVLAGAAAGVWRTTDFGETWAESDSGITTKNVHWVFVDTCRAHASYGWALAGTWGSGVFRSTDDGLTWQPMNSGLHGTQIVKIVGDVYGDITAISDSGAFVWHNSDSSWRSLPWPFSSAATNLMITPDRRIFVSPYGVNLQRSTGVLTSARPGTPPFAQGLSLYPNYPNPFNPETTISFALPAASLVSLRVYDILGREVAVLVNERRSAGMHNVRFDGSTLASGVYFYRLQAGSFVATRKLLLLK